MKRIGFSFFMVAFVLHFMVYTNLIYSQDRLPGGILYDELTKKVQNYLVNKFNQYIHQPNLGISYVSCTDNRARSALDPNLNYVLVQANFKNFPINNRIISDRLETEMTIRKSEKLFAESEWVINDADNTGIKITLLIDDLLTDDLRQALVKNFIQVNYPTMIDTDIMERIESYGTKTYSYVSGVVNNNSIVFLCAIFEQPSPIIKDVDIFKIIETPWSLNRAEIIFNKEFPNKDRYKNDLEKELLEPLRGYYTQTRGKTNFGSTSKIENITGISLDSATNGVIKIKLDIQYALDLFGLFNYQKYTLPVYAFYQFNFDTSEWEFKNLDKLDTTKIIATK